ncbi:MAG TPA: AbrB/MazE/SpoVT family DNA-binding domain-containing protein [Acidobacteriaceae bacterium]
MKTAEKRAKLFMNGRSQAVRLPKEFRFEGKEVRIRKSGSGVLLEPVAAQIGSSDLESVRKVLKTLEPLAPEVSAMVEDAMRKLQN